MPMDDIVEEVSVLLGAPLLTLAVLVGEGAAALDHAVATRVELPMLEQLTYELALCTGVWSARRVGTGDLDAALAGDPHVAIADARAYASAHPAELAAYDQAFAEFRDQRMGEG